MIFVPADENEPVRIEDRDSKPTLEELQKAVGGGLIERVPYFNQVRFDKVGINSKARSRTCVAFCNEEGKLKDMDINARATTMWADSLGRPAFDILLGNVVILTGDSGFKA